MPFKWAFWGLGNPVKKFLKYAIVQMLGEIGIGRMVESKEEYLSLGPERFQSSYV